MSVSFPLLPATPKRQKAGLAVNGRSRRLRLLAIASIISVSALYLAAAPAHATNIYIHYTNFSSGLCLGISGGQDNAPAVQWNCNGHPDQQWTRGAVNNLGYGQEINLDGECLGVAGGSTAEGATVVGWNCNGHSDQYWYPGTVTCNGSTVEVLFNYKSNYVLGVQGGSTANGATLVQWRWQQLCNNQDWYAS